LNKDRPSHRFFTIHKERDKEQRKRKREREREREGEGEEGRRGGRVAKESENTGHSRGH